MSEEVWKRTMNYLPGFATGVLTALDANGYPYSVRCKPQPDQTAHILYLDLPEGIALQPGPAGLLCHRHDNKLWNLVSFLVRGTLQKTATGWALHPEQFIPGAGIKGPLASLRMYLAMRQVAARYLKKRGIARPKIPWEAVKATRQQPK